MEIVECHVCRNAECCKAREIPMPNGKTQGWCYVCWNRKYNAAFDIKREFKNDLERKYYEELELNFHIPNFYGEIITESMRKEIEHAYAYMMGWIKLN